jgi:hypothetical protein
VSLDHHYTFANVVFEFRIDPDFVLNELNVNTINVCWPSAKEMIFDLFPNCWLHPQNETVIIRTFHQERQFLRNRNILISSGFLAGTVKKKLGFPLTSSKPNDVARRYRIETRRAR